MNSKVSAAFKKLETTRQDICDLVRAVPDQVFFHHPKGKWSISQILSHIILAERLSLQYMKKKALGIRQLDSTSLGDELKYLLLKFSQRIPLRYKAPPVLGEAPPAERTLQEIEKQWGEERTQLEDFLYVLEDGEIKKRIYKHPVAGRLNVIHALDFFNEHALHHLPQIKQIIRHHKN